MNDIEIRTTAEETVAYLPMRGAYAQIPEAMGRLYGWMAQHGFQPMGMPGAVYYSAPDEGPESEAEWELYAPVTGDPPAADIDAAGCGIKRRPAREVAVMMHHGPYETIRESYDLLMAWVAGNGYGIVGPPEESYLSDPADVMPRDYLTEIRIPIGKQ